MLAFFCLGARYRPWRYSAALHSRVFGDGAAPRRSCCSPQPRQHSVFRASGGGVLQVLPSVPFFFAGRAAVIWCGANPGVRPWQDLRECALGLTGSGNILARCVPKRLSVARFRRGAFPGINPWQVLRSMHPKSGLGRENRQFAARFARHASENGLALAGYARHASEKPRKPPFGNAPREDLARKGRFSLHGPLDSCIVRRSCHPASTKRPSARNPCAAEQCEPPELDRPTQETQPRRQRPRRLLGSKYRQQPPRYRHRSLPTPASSLSPRRTTLSSPTAPPVETASTSPPPR